MDESLSLHEPPTPRTETRRLTLTVTEAAEALGIGRATAYECVRTGELPSVKIGGRILIPTKRLHEMLEPADTDTPDA